LHLEETRKQTVPSPEREGGIAGGVEALENAARGTAIASIISSRMPV
jgi:hypothetical protein